MLDKLQQKYFKQEAHLQAFIFVYVFLHWIMAIADVSGKLSNINTRFMPLIKIKKQPTHDTKNNNDNNNNDKLENKIG